MSRLVVRLENGRFFGMFGIEFDTLCNDCIWTFWSKKELNDLLIKYGYKKFKIERLGA